MDLHLSDKVWKASNSIISVPIHDSNKNIIGVLNMYTNLNIGKTKFYDQDFKSAVWSAANCLGKYLEKKSLKFNKVYESFLNGCGNKSVN